MMKRLSILIVVIFVLPSLAFSYDLFIQSFKAPLFKSPSIGCEKLMVLSKGERVKGIEENKNWYKVQCQDKIGWIYKLMARKTAPLDNSKVFGDQIAELSDNVRRRPSSFSTTAAARGLKEKRKRFSDKYVLDYQALEKIEAMVINPKEAIDFLTKGMSNEKNL
jgi:hypothetical protein